MSFLYNFILLSFIASFTPGPNNSMLMHSGMYFGLRGTRRHMLGVLIGFSFLFFCINMGIYAIIQSKPSISIAMKVIGTLYFAYLAYRMITLSPPSEHSDDVSNTQKAVQPLGFWKAFFFQWINIKAWFYSFSAISSLPSERSWLMLLYVQLIILAITTSSALTWTLGGVVISSIFKNPVTLRIISIILSLSLVYIAIAQWF